MILVLAIIGISLAVRVYTGANSPDTELILERPQAITVRVLTALPIEPWIRSATESFNAQQPTLEDVPIEVEVIAPNGERLVD